MRVNSLTILDVSDPEIVEFQVKQNKNTNLFELWIHVDGLCMFKATRISEVFVLDERDNRHNVLDLGHKKRKK